jgi:hypothetical protein
VLAAAVDVNPLLDETRCVVVVDVDGFDVHAPVSIKIIFVKEILTFFYC